MNKIIGLVLLLSLAGCASVQSLSLTQIPAKRTEKVQTQASKFIILGFNFNNDFVDDAVEDLKRQCPNGIVTGILTKDEVISYIFAHRRQITATGYCLKESTKQASR